MSLVPVITQADLEKGMGGVKVVAQYTNDAGGSLPDPVNLAWILQKATDEGGGALLSAYSADEIVALVAADTAVQGYFIDIACGMCGARRPTIRDDRGKTMWFDERARAYKTLQDTAAAQKRSIAEGQGIVPVNPLTVNETNYKQPVDFHFAPTSARPHRGGGF